MELRDEWLLRWTALMMFLSVLTSKERVPNMDSEDQVGIV